MTESAFDRVRRQKRELEMTTMIVKSGVSHQEAFDIMSRWKPTLPGFRNSLLGVEADPEHWRRKDLEPVVAGLMEWDDALRQPTAVAFV